MQDIYVWVCMTVILLPSRQINQINFTDNFAWKIFIEYRLKYKIRIQTIN